METEEVFEICKLFRFITVDNYSDQLKLHADGMLSYEQWKDIERLLNEMVRVAGEWADEENPDQTEE